MSLLPEELVGKIDSYYEKGDFYQPNHDKNPKEKLSGKFFAQVGNYLLHQYFNNRAAFPYSWPSTKRSFSELRAYAAGKPPLEKFIEEARQCNVTDKQGNRKAFVNISA